MKVQLSLGIQGGLIPGASADIKIQNLQCRVPYIKWWIQSALLICEFHNHGYRGPTVSIFVPSFPLADGRRRTGLGKVSGFGIHFFLFLIPSCPLDLTWVIFFQDTSWLFLKRFHFSIVSQNSFAKILHYLTDSRTPCRWDPTQPTEGNRPPGFPHRRFTLHEEFRCQPGPL